MEETPHVDREEGWEEAQDAEMRARTATYKQELVDEAKQLGINPDNFESEEDLEVAIQLRKSLLESDD